MKVKKATKKKPRTFHTIAVFDEAYDAAKAAVERMNRESMVPTNLSQFVSVAIVERVARVMKELA